MLKDTVGFRNKNPGNLRYSPAQTFLGQIGVDPKGYLIFDTMENGVRAMVKVLRTYLRSGVNTPEKIAARYAPPSDNNPTAAYSGFIAAKLGIPTNGVVDEGRMPELVSGMIEFENGGGLSAAVLAEGVRLAYVG